MKVEQNLEVPKKKGIKQQIRDLSPSQVLTFPRSRYEYICRAAFLVRNENGTSYAVRLKGDNVHVFVKNDEDGDNRNS